ncbi:hypothetical protein RV14_GL002140 [Enterococcus ratti]|uniref:Uncharacterized protein n=1 Tax=Enterococcus ratti TaxID=150033 RepID=A0A1L8WP95_9ENTE|nr:hypothetical protein RV14_GL002140 [Enterococcus ratti]
MENLQIYPLVNKDLLFNTKIYYACRLPCGYIVLVNNLVTPPKFSAVMSFDKGLHCPKA